MTMTDVENGGNEWYTNRVRVACSSIAASLQRVAWQSRPPDARTSVFEPDAWLSTSVFSRFLQRRGKGIQGEGSQQVPSHATFDLGQPIGRIGDPVEI
jgi:hypothetical protein